MNSKTKILTGVIIIGGIALIGGGWIWIKLLREAVPSTKEWKTYTKSQYSFSFKYPLSWEIETDGGDYFITLIPSNEKAWQPKKPDDIPKDPRIKLIFGKYVRETLGFGSFPETTATLETWLRTRADKGPERDFAKRIINGFPAFEITEISDPGCEKVIYWRPVNLDSLIRIQTACESRYLGEFDQIVNTLQQTK